MRGRVRDTKIYFDIHGHVVMPANLPAALPKAVKLLLDRAALLKEIMRHDCPPSD